MRLNAVLHHLETSLSGFATDALSALPYIAYIFVILLIIFWIIQTTVFATRTAFARCCAVAHNPVGLVLAVVLGVTGIAATSAGVAAFEVCEHAADLASRYLSESPVFPVLGLDPLVPSVFASPDGSLYDLLGLGDRLAFDVPNTSAIPVESWEAPPPSLVNAFRSAFATNHSQISAELHALAAGALRLRARCSHSPAFTDLLAAVDRLTFSAIAIIDKEIPQQISAAASLGEVHTPAALAANLTAASAFLRHWNFSTAALACPLREVKEHFCAAAGTAIASAAVSLHLYLLALIGFGVLLFARRRGMLPPIVAVPATVAVSEESAPPSPRPAPFLNPFARTGPVGTDSDSSPSFDSYQRARITVV
jgi:hypothetical protein